jgi:hypothetical protein
MSSRIELPVVVPASGDPQKKCRGRCGGRCPGRCLCKCRRRLAATIEPLEGRVLLSTITGTVFSDRNGNGVQDSGEPGLAGVTVFLDTNNNGVLDAGETSTTTNSSGAYSFTVNDSPNKTYVVAQQLPAGYAAKSPVGNAVATQNVDITKRSGNESEQAIAIDPTNPSRVFMCSNVASGSFLEGAYSTDGGATWTTRNMATGSDGLTAACCDPSLAWDAYGNLFLVYLNSTVTQVIVARSTNGGQSFTQIATLGATDVDQPTVAVGPGQNGVGGSVWVLFNQPINNGNTDVLKLAGASVTGLGSTVSFGTPATVPSGSGSYGDVAVGPSGQVMIVYQQTGTGNAPAQVYMNVDADGLGSGALSARTTLFTTNVGDFDYIPAQSTRSVDAEVGLAWDRSGGAHNGRVYLMYTDETPDESNNMDVYVKFSDNNGASWSTPVKVNDDATTNSQFLPRIALDQTTGNIAVTWHDCRRDNGGGAPGDTNGIANDDAQYWGTMSTNGGTSFLPNLQISAGTSNAADAKDGIDYGDYTGLAFQSGVFMPAWADNSNSTGNNPNGALSSFDIYTARVLALPAGTAGRYSVVAGSTQGASGLNFADHDTTAPTATIGAVTPNPRTTPVSSMTITFSKPVVGFDLSDLQLTRGGSATNLLTSSQTLTTSDNITFTLGNLAGLTATAGTYTLTLNASGTGITDTSGNAIAGGASGSFTVNATVAGRFVFYNGSAYDGNDETANAADDGAIAPDKNALLPGQTATFANYTSFFHGINGIMIDVQGLASGGTLGPSDFSFKVGASTDPSTWATAPAPTSITVRSGAGTGGSDRITLLWGDNAIQNTWLQITVNATANTGLASADVFYFGNVIGESGNSSSTALVTIADVNMAKALQGSATITSPVDFNRNGIVTIADVNIAKAYQNASIPLFTAPAAPAASAAVPAASSSKHTRTRAGSALASPVVPLFSMATLAPWWPFDLVDPTARKKDLLL